MRRFTTSFSLLLVVCVTGFADAALVIDFKPEPTNQLPEVLFAGGGAAVPVLREGPGAIGNGDGSLPPNQQTPGGLTVEIPYAVPGIPGGTVNVTGTTTIRDVTLRLTGLEQSGAPATVGSVTTQGLSAGTFQLVAGDGLGAPPVPFLQGTIGDAAIVLHPGSIGAVLSSSVSYTGGLIPEVAGLTGDLAFSLVNITPLGIIGPGLIVDFSADATGQFTIVPEPAAFTFLGTGALLGARRRARLRRPAAPAAPAARI